MLTLVFLLLLLPRLWIVFNSSYIFYSDDAVYAILARFWVEGDWQKAFHPTWPPLYPALSAFFYLFIRHWEIASRLVAMLAGTAILIPMFFLVRKTVSLAGALSFILALSLFTPLLIMSLMALSDSLAVLLIVSGIVTTFFALLNLSEIRNIKLLFLGSFLFGLSYLTRAEGTMFFFFTFMYLTVYFLLKRQIRLLLKVVIPFTLVFLLTVSPYLIAIRGQIGEWSLSQKFSAQIQQGHSFALNSRKTTWAQEAVSAKYPDYQSPYFKNGAEFVLDRLYILLSQYFPKQLKWEEVFLSIFPFWSVLLMLVGVISSFKKRYFWSWLYIFFVMVTAIPITIFSTPVQDVRYLAWTIPLFLYFFYRGMGKLITLISITKHWRNKIFATTAFLTVLFFPGTSLDNLINPQKIVMEFNKTYDMSELKIVGGWIAHNFSGSNPRVMLRHEGVEFYTQGQTIYMPEIPFNQLIEYAKKNKVDYIVAWDKELGGDTNLSSLLDDQISHPGLIKVFSPALPNKKIVVYTLERINE